MAGGTNQKNITLPRFYETALQQQVGQARDTAQIGYTPYYGPDVAAFSPMQDAAIQNTNDAAAAFGMASANPTASYMPETTTMGGVTGYASQPLMEASMDAFSADRPGQASFIESMTIDPVTGAPGSRSLSNQPVALEMTAAQKRGK